jgi:hypothetical protein
VVYRARLHARWIRRAAPLLVVAACGGASPSCFTSENTAAVGGAAGTAGNGAGARAGNACDSPNEENYQKLQSCNVGNRCSMRRVRGYGEPHYLWLGGHECLLSSLRDRTPGTYSLYTEHSDSCQWDNEVLVVDTDGNVFVSSAHDYSGGPPQSCPRDSCLSYGATRRCTLMPPDFFDECLALGLEPSTGGGAGAAPDDDWTLPPECYVWYTDCYLAEPTCPAE